MTIEVLAGVWRVAAKLDEQQRCHFTPCGWLREVWRREHLASATQVAAATVEVRRKSGGLNPCALVSGSLGRAPSDRLIMEVAHSGVLTAGRPKDCEGLMGQPFSVGLPTEFAQAVVDGLVRVETESPVAGTLRVAGGGYDDVESSPVAFEFAGGVLRLILEGQLNKQEFDLAVLLSKLPQR